MKSTHDPSRRTFLKQSAAGAGLLILPSGVVSGKNSPGNKLNIALIGTGGRATRHFEAVSGENVVALCDVDENHMAKAAKQFAGAKHYVDWRRCLEQKDLDAIVCSTTDHTHAHVANWAMARGIHVYCEKPLANTVGEARAVRSTYLGNEANLATQVGTQLHANNNFAKVRELIREGAIGELKGVSAWGNRQLPKPGYFQAKGTPPKHLHYDLWIGPSAFHPYHPGYFEHDRPGSNCLNWNMFWDFGSGQVGDMGSHTMDLVWNAIDAAPPTSISAEGDPFNPDVTPVKLTSHFEIPANDWRKAIKLSWYQGGAMPDEPVKNALRGIGHGALFEGTDAWLVSDFGSHVIIPKSAKDGDRFSRTGVKGGYNHQAEWITACKGEGKTSCHFDYAGQMIETMLLGLVAYRTGETIKYDAATGKITNSEKANSLINRSYREGWSLMG
ncbi:Gfo/Idh/MocA family protein [Haloferula rosea]|uniref:Gfo/Idh/MocA family oxidoreductase n=1 Tax=Haloferula rosea TaxID=490093 RepID=A0A934RCI8_9BACT|nr:Gfo/Idh/MocA family oxidoreductase [Haloferula rosea]MBK1828040.1 Gfo/Idh/MocA family oxidoreductase [Haloferula rosea]